jgi:hypothetical protein
LTSKQTDARFCGIRALSASWHATVSTVVTADESRPEFGTTQTEGRAAIQSGVGVGLGVGVGVGDGKLTMGIDMTLLDVEFDVMTGEDKADGEFASEEELMGLDEVDETFVGTDADDTELRMGGTMTVLNVVLNEMADEDEADEETALEEERMGSGEVDEDTVGIDNMRSTDGVINEGRIVISLEKVGLLELELLGEISSLETSGDSELDVLIRADEVPVCCGSTMAEFRDAWLLAMEMLDVEANLLVELGIVTDVDK